MYASIALPGSRHIANDGLKQRSSNFFAAGIVAAAILHLLVLAYFPRLSIANFARDATELASLDIIQPIDIPPPPDVIARPAVPLMSTDLNLDDDYTIAPTIFDENLPIGAPPPNLGVVTDPGPDRAWTPYEVSPDLRNRDEYSRALQRRYPATLRNAGIGGTVRLAIQLDDRGTVQRVEVEQSSGYIQLDDVATELVQQVARFSPALNRSQPVAVWISLPVTFEVP